ncbi:class I SAM-dependent methyltransferase [Candidatus Uhrbacteria bacterium]|nr:class I SAM-dependent methyltransferase [Candidatus Uhrbacteria bacterium]
MILSFIILGASIVLVVMSVLFFFMLLGFLEGLPYVPTKQKTVEKIIEISHAQEGEKVADLGSGDGRILIEFAKKGIEAHGFEINPLLVWHSRKNIRTRGFGDKAIVYHKNFWKQDFSSYDIIVVYGIGYIMKKLEEKLGKELKPGARIISSAFEFPTWKATVSSNGLFLYDNPDKNLPK